MRRQSFYDHFRDKYDVLAEIYDLEVNQAVRYCGDYRLWPQTLEAMLNYFNANQVFYQHVLRLDVQNAPEEVIVAHLKSMVGKIFVSLGEVEKISIDTKYCAFLQATLGGALFQSLKQWLYRTDDISVQVEYQYLKHFLEDGINGFLLRARHQASISLAQSS